VDILQRRSTVWPSFFIGEIIIMPTYNFRNLETGEEIEVMMKIAELDEFKAANPHLQQFLTKAPSLNYDSASMGFRKTDDNFNSLLKHIKKGNSQGIHTKSTIKTR
jgi:predicted nucleic acid-binding Zn ribbon protein